MNKKIDNIKLGISMVKRKKMIKEIVENIQNEYEIKVMKYKWKIQQNNLRKKKENKKE